MMMMIQTECDICSAETTLEVDYADLYAHQIMRVPMQKAFPYLTPAERELFFGVGWCSACWDKQLGFDGEDY